MLGSSLSPGNLAEEDEGRQTRMSEDSVRKQDATKPWISLELPGQYKRSFLCFPDLLCVMEMQEPPQPAPGNPVLGRRSQSARCCLGETV